MTTVEGALGLGAASSVIGGIGAVRAQRSQAALARYQAQVLRNQGYSARDLAYRESEIAVDFGVRQQGLSIAGARRNAALSRASSGRQAVQERERARALRLRHGELYREFGADVVRTGEEADVIFGAEDVAASASGFNFRSAGFEEKRRSNRSRLYRAIGDLTADYSYGAKALLSEAALAEANASFITAIGDYEATTGLELAERQANLQLASVLEQSVLNRYRGDLQAYSGGTQANVQSFRAREATSQIPLTILGTALNVAGPFFSSGGAGSSAGGELRADL